MEFGNYVLKLLSDSYLITCQQVAWISNDSVTSSVHRELNLNGIHDRTTPMAFSAIRIMVITEFFIFVRAEFVFL